ncbi:MAG: hypothetical protein MUE46_03840 [Xanthomonadales bacterium]|nr:hypothetical protein [Xanthomonadales bacterium]
MPQLSVTLSAVISSADNSSGATSTDTLKRTSTGAPAVAVIRRALRSRAVVVMKSLIEAGGGATVYSPGAT